MSERVVILKWRAFIITITFLKIRSRKGIQGKAVGSIGNGDKIKKKIQGFLKEIYARKDYHIKMKGY